MQIRNILAGHPDPAAARRGENIEAAVSRSADALDQHAPSAATAATAMAEILSHYDVTDISPAEFSQMIQRLFEAGTLSRQELEQLATIRMDLDLEDVQPDESIDLLEFYTHQIEKAQRRLSDPDAPAAADRQLAPLLARLDWMQKFALIQSTPDAIGLDAMA